MSKIKRLAGETALYGLGNIIPRLLNFLLFPIHTLFFDPEEYGVLTILMSFVGLLNVVYSFGMETAYFRFVSVPGADQKKIFNLTQTAVIFISTALSIILILNASFFAKALGAEGHENFIVWLTLIMFIDNAVSIPFARLRFEKKPIRFAFYRISNVAILTALNFYFLYFAYDPAVGVGYVFIANLIANSFYFLFFLKDFAQWRPQVDKEVTTTLFKYSFPIMITGLAAMMNEFFSRLSLEQWLPKNFYPGRSSEFAVGVFGGCYKLSVIMNLTIQAFRMAGEPFFFSQATEKKSPQLFAKVNHYFILVCCVILLATSINLDILKLLMQNSAYWEGIYIVPPLLLGYLFLGVYYNFTIWFKLTDRTYYGTIITIAGAVLTFILNCLFVPMGGYYASSWITAVVYGFMMIACYVLGQKHYPIPYFVLRGLSYITLTYVIGMGVNLIHIPNQLLATSFHFIVIGSFCGAIYILERKLFVIRS
jgi:O-antigen/teichoic acid export membrane protein